MLGLPTMVRRLLDGRKPPPGVESSVPPPQMRRTTVRDAPGTAVDLALCDPAVVMTADEQLMLDQDIAQMMKLRRAAAAESGNVKLS